MGTSQAYADTVGTSGSERTFRVVAGLMGAYLLAALLLLPFAGVPGPAIPGIASIMVAGVVLGELATSFLLFAWFRESGDGSLLLLACTGLYAGALAVLHLLTFPGGLMPNRIVLGSPQSVSWTYLFWVNGYGALTLSSVLLEAFAAGRRIVPQHIGRSMAAGVAVTLVLIGCAGVWAIVLPGRLPALTVSGSWTLLSAIVNDVAIALLATGIVLIMLVIRARHALFLWLALAMTSVLFSNIVSVAAGGRYTLGWMVGRATWFVSACIVFLFFMGQFIRQQRLLHRAKETLEQRVRERTDDLSRAIRQRDGLLREVYHRVSNNLQIVDALIAMEGRRLQDAAARLALRNLRNRIFILGLAHGQLMVAEDLETFPILPFLREIARFACSPSVVGHDVTPCVEGDCMNVNLDFAIPLGLLTAELIALATRDAGAGMVAIGFHRQSDGSARLRLRHDGDGRALESLLTPRAGVGNRIIAGLTRQLDGRLDPSREPGTWVDIRMPSPESSHAGQSGSGGG